MSLGHVGKWRITTKSSSFSEADLQAMERDGYEIVSISSHSPDFGVYEHTCYARYRGGMRGPASK